MAFVFGLAACGRCNRSATTGTEAGAEAFVDGGSDAALAATPSPMQPVAYSSAEARIHRLADGAIVLTHGPIIDELLDDGPRERLASITDGPVGVAGGTRDDVLFATIRDRYPAGTDSTSWRLRNGKRERILPRKDDFYLKTARWDGDRILALRANGAVRWEFNSFPWTPEAFVVIRGAPASVPVIPKALWIEDFVAFPSGTVIALATRHRDPSMMVSGREKPVALHWKGTTLEVLPVAPDDHHHSAQHIAARAEDDVWIGGTHDEGPSWFAHWDGRTWTREGVDFSEPVRSMAVAADGALWIVADGMLATPNANVLHRRAPFGKGKDWSTIDLPPLHAKVRSPRLKYERGQVQVATATTLDADELQPDTVEPRATGGVWIAARFHEMAMPNIVLFRSGSEPVPFVDLDVEDARAYDDHSTPVTDDCEHLFVSGGDPEPTILTRVASAARPDDLIVIARLDGKRVVGSLFEKFARESADELVTTWRKLALPATIRCAMPPLEELVVAPKEHAP